MSENPELNDNVPPYMHRKMMLGNFFRITFAIAIMVFGIVRLADQSDIYEFIGALLFVSAGGAAVIHQSMQLLLEILVCWTNYRDTGMSPTRAKTTDNEGV